jgi:hypothetical protein
VFLKVFSLNHKYEKAAITKKLKEFNKLILKNSAYPFVLIYHLKELVKRRSTAQKDGTF